MRRTLTMIVTTALLLGACTSGEGAPRGDIWDRAGQREAAADANSGINRSPGGGGGRVGIGIAASHAALQQFDACESFLQWVRAAAAEHVGPYGLDPMGGYMVEEAFAMGGDDMADMAMEDSDGSGAMTAAPVAGEQASGEFSTTNVQEEGVDEPDLVKTDGTRLYLVARGTLYSIDVSGSTPVVIDQIRLGEDDYTTADLLLGTDRLYAITSVWAPTVFPTDDPAASTDDLSGGDSLMSDFVEGYSMVKVVEIAVSADGTLSEASQLSIDGSYVAARRIGDGVRLVVRHDVGNRLGFLYPSQPNRQGEDAATEHNRQVILDSSLEDWVASYRLASADGTTTTGLVTDCTRMTAPQEFSGASSVSVLSLDMTRPLDSGNAVTLFGAADTVYASTGSLYTATYAFPPMMPLMESGDPASDPAPEFTSQIHRFDITDPTGASYVASGEAPGRLLNQWAMSEYDGHLRVATTDGSPWWGGADTATSSSVVVFRTDGRDLVPTGVVDGLGVNEDIVGVRFIGPTGYVVTFRRTDPLYVLDLSDPAAPTMDGELKITGYSGYLHPVGEGYLLGVGQEATEDGMAIGTKVSLFDVSDPTAPAEVDRWILPDSSSSVEWDHRGFLYWPSDQLAVVPLDWAPNDAGAVVLRVGDGTLEEVGQIVQQPPAGGGMNPACRGAHRRRTAQRVHRHGLGRKVGAVPGGGTPVERTIRMRFMGVVLRNGNRIHRNRGRARHRHGLRLLVL